MRFACARVILLPRAASAMSVSVSAVDRGQEAGGGKEEGGSLKVCWGSEGFVGLPKPEYFFTVS